MAVIYRATNSISGKSYIGFTRQSFESRKAQHFYHSKKTKSKFYDAIRSYGWDAFVWEILLEDATLEDERRLIEEHDTIRAGYNLKDGGNQVVQFSEESRRKMSASAKVKPISDGFREKCRRRMTGIKQSPALIEKRALALSKTWAVLTPEGESLTILNLNSFCKERGLNPGKMSMVANGIRPHHKGYKVSEVF